MQPLWLKNQLEKLAVPRYEGAKTRDASEPRLGRLSHEGRQVNAAQNEGREGCDRVESGGREGCARRGPRHRHRGA